jgi:hypothetical protein
MASNLIRDAYAGFKIPKKRKHEVSESEEDSGSDDNSNGDQYGDPNDFLQQFGGYETNHSDDEYEGEYKFH